MMDSPVVDDQSLQRAPSDGPFVAFCVDPTRPVLRGYRLTPAAHGLALDVVMPNAAAELPDGHPLWARIEEIRRAAAGPIGLAKVPACVEAGQGHFRVGVARPVIVCRLRLDAQGGWVGGLHTVFAAVDAVEPVALSESAGATDRFAALWQLACQLVAGRAARGELAMLDEARRRYADGAGCVHTWSDPRALQLAVVTQELDLLVNAAISDWMAARHAPFLREAQVASLQGDPASHLPWAAAWLGDTGASERMGQWVTLIGQPVYYAAEDRFHWARNRRNVGTFACPWERYVDLLNQRQLVSTLARTPRPWIARDMKRQARGQSDGAGTLAMVLRDEEAQPQVAMARVNEQMAAGQAVLGRLVPVERLRQRYRQSIADDLTAGRPTVAKRLAYGLSVATADVIRQAAARYLPAIRGGPHVCLQEMKTLGRLARLECTVAPDVADPQRRVATLVASRNQAVYRVSGEGADEVAAKDAASMALLRELCALPPLAPEPVVAPVRAAPPAPCLLPEQAALVEQCRALGYAAPRFGWAPKAANGTYRCRVSVMERATRTRLQAWSDALPSRNEGLAQASVAMAMRLAARQRLSAGAVTPTGETDAAALIARCRQLWTAERQFLRERAPTVSGERRARQLDQFLAHLDWQRRRAAPLAADPNLARALERELGRIAAYAEPSTRVQALVEVLDACVPALPIRSAMALAEADALAHAACRLGLDVPALMRQLRVAGLVAWEAGAAPVLTRRGARELRARRGDTGQQPRGTPPNPSPMASLRQGRALLGASLDEASQQALQRLLDR
ncbi:hypothetical protein [Cupriavidus sp. TMH.W2]|uniref:hypothetical protein n=1 Tax=Cupriavidus sp. TMH.W2 TaxID=3434465 RepID=UPI003D77E495